MLEIIEKFLKTNFGVTSQKFLWITGAFGSIGFVTVLIREIYGSAVGETIVEGPAGLVFALENFSAEQMTDNECCDGALVFIGLFR